MAITLYDSPVSPHTRKVRLLAAELDIPLTRVPMDFQKGDFRSPAYLAKNPNGTVPTIEDDGFVLWESAAILKYLAAKKPERGFWPGDPKAQALIDQWLIWWSAHPGSAWTHLLWERRIKPYLGKPANDPSIVSEADAALGRYLPVLDRQLSGRDYVLGGLGVVDFAIAPPLDVAEAVQLDITPYRNITAWLGRLRAEPYWKDA